MTESSKIARICARIAYEKRAEDIVVLDLRKLTDVTDYMLVASVGSPQQGSAIIQELKHRLLELGVEHLGREGNRQDKWILVDFGEVIVHLFEPTTRTFYDIENLWGDAPRLDLEDSLEGNQG
ncbi:MAG: ribosome silencing factor [Planctomycetota bacterium]|nr:ribosome silencing factor [Planctomycetota bacterium]